MRCGAAPPAAAAAARGAAPGSHRPLETLWNLVGTRFSEEFVQGIAAATDPALHGSDEGVRQLMAAYMGHWRRHPRALRLQLWRLLDAPKKERKARSEQLNALFVPALDAAQRAGHVRRDVPPGLLMVTVGGLIQYFLHSDVETRDALAVTGAPPLGAEAALDYLWSLIAAEPAGRGA